MNSRKEIEMDIETLRSKLIRHYKAFEYGHVWVDDFSEKDKYVVVEHFYNAPPPKINIPAMAKYIRSLLGKQGDEYTIHIGGYYMNPLDRI